MSITFAQTSTPPQSPLAYRPDVDDFCVGLGKVRLLIDPMSIRIALQLVQLYTFHRPCVDGTLLLDLFGPWFPGQTCIGPFCRTFDLMATMYARCIRQEI